MQGTVLRVGADVLDPRLHVVQPREDIRDLLFAQLAAPGEAVVEDLQGIRSTGRAHGFRRAEPAVTTGHEAALALVSQLGCRGHDRTGPLQKV